MRNLALGISLNDGIVVAVEDVGATRWLDPKSVDAGKLNHGTEFGASGTWDERCSDPCTWPAADLACIGVFGRRNDGLGVVALIDDDEFEVMGADGGGVEIEGEFSVRGRHPNGKEVVGIGRGKGQCENLACANTDGIEGGLIQRMSWGHG